MNASSGLRLRLSMEMPPMARLAGAALSPRVALRISSKVQSGSVTCFSQRRRNGVVIGKRNDLVADNLAGLMAFAGDQQHIAGA